MATKRSSYYRYFEHFPKSRYIARMAIFEFFVTLGLILTPIDLTYSIISEHALTSLLSIKSLLNLSSSLNLAMAFIAPVAVSISLALAIKTGIDTAHKFDKYKKQEAELQQEITELCKNKSDQEINFLVKKLEEIDYKNTTKLSKKNRVINTIQEHAKSIVMCIITSSAFLFSLAGITGVNIISTTALLGPVSPLLLTFGLIITWSVLGIMHTHYENKLTKSHKIIKKFLHDIKTRGETLDYASKETPSPPESDLTDEKKQLHANQLLCCLYKKIDLDKPALELEARNQRIFRKILNDS